MDLPLHLSPLPKYRPLRGCRTCYPLRSVRGRLCRSRTSSIRFLIGDWTIKQEILKADGSWFEADATTKVSPILKGCALLEHWKGEVLFFWEGMEKAEPLEGFSVRAYDAKTKQWVLSWMDSRHPRLGEFVGGFSEGRGEFFRKSRAKDGKQATTRITFSDITPTAVHWDLAVSSDNGKNWRTFWIMEMT